MSPKPQIPSSSHSKPKKRQSPNNKYGKNGVFKCQQCRKAHRRCVPDDRNTPCEICVKSGQASSCSRSLPKEKATLRPPPSKRFIFLAREGSLALWNAIHDGHKTSMKSEQAERVQSEKRAIAVLKDKLSHYGPNYTYAKDTSSATSPAHQSGATPPTSDAVDSSQSPINRSALMFDEGSLDTPSEEMDRHQSFPPMSYDEKLSLLCQTRPNDRLSQLLCQILSQHQLLLLVSCLEFSHEDLFDPSNVPGPHFLHVVQQDREMLTNEAESA